MARDGFPSGRPKITAAHHAFLVVTVVACRLLLISACPTYDDAFITYRYAQNAADGLGMVFNPGSPWEPVLGTTTPLFAWILYVCGKIGLDLVTAALALGIACDAVSAILIPRLFGRVRSTSTWALLAFAVFPPLVRISVGGMESPLFGMFALLAVTAFADEKPMRAGTWSALTCVVRPEGVLLCLVLIAAQLLQKNRRRGGFGPLVAPMVVIGVIAIAVLTWKYGSPIPQSVVAKSQMKPPDPTGSTLSRLKSILSQAYLPYTWLLPLLPFVVFGAFRALQAQRSLRYFSFFALAMVLAYAIARPHTWGWYYYVPLLAWTFWFAIGFDRFVRWLARGFGPALAGAAGTIGAPLGGAAALGAALYVGLRYESRVPRDVYEPFGKWAQATSTAEPGARILASDIGIVGWTWRGVVLDSEGLVWPEALRHGSVNAILEAEHPEYFVLVAERTFMLHLLQRPDVIGGYEAIARYNTTNNVKLDPTPDELDVVWNPDYIVYRRRAR